MSVNRKLGTGNWQLGTQMNCQNAKIYYGDKGFRLLSPPPPSPDSYRDWHPLQRGTEDYEQPTKN